MILITFISSQINYKEIDEMTASGLGPKACHIVDVNWMTLLNHTKTSCDGLRTFIKHKRDEFQILQDGVCIEDIISTHVDCHVYEDSANTGS